MKMFGGGKLPAAKRVFLSQRKKLEYANNINVVLKYQCNTWPYIAVEKLQIVSQDFLTSAENSTLKLPKSFEFKYIVAGHSSFRAHHAFSDRISSKLVAEPAVIPHLVHFWKRNVTFYRGSLAREMLTSDLKRNCSFRMFWWVYLMFLKCSFGHDLDGISNRFLIRSFRWLSQAADCDGTRYQITPTDDTEYTMLAGYYHCRKDHKSDRLAKYATCTDILFSWILNLVYVPIVKHFSHVISFYNGITQYLAWRNQVTN